MIRPEPFKDYFNPLSPDYLYSMRGIRSPPPPGFSFGCSSSETKAEEFAREFLSRDIFNNITNREEARDTLEKLYDKAEKGQKIVARTVSHWFSADTIELSIED